jgi:uncharacterized protein (DUF2141 family)
MTYEEDVAMRKQDLPSVVRVCLVLLTVLLCSVLALAQNSASEGAGHQLQAAIPFIDVTSPTAARVHGSGFVLILDGAGFAPDAEVGFQVGSRTHLLWTYVVNEGELAAWVPAELLKEAATASITVTNRHQYGRSVASNPALLPITIPTASVAFEQTTITPGPFPFAIVTADFNGDGRSDLAVSVPCTTCGSDTGGKVVILLARHDGTFFAAPSVAVGEGPSSLATGDFNGDGKIDIAVANQQGSAVTILLNDGLGRFTPVPFTVPVDGQPSFVAVGDFNRDGKLDLAVPIFNLNLATKIDIRLGRGDGTFTDGTPVEVPTGGLPTVTVADLNRDGILDLVVETDIPNVLAFAGKGDGTFSALPAPPVPPVYTPGEYLAFGDVNGDGKLDLVFTSAQGFPFFSDAKISTALGSGSGLFHAGPTSPQTLVNGFGLGLLADFNADGKLDYALETGEDLGLYLGNGHGSFNLASSLPLETSFSAGVVGDFNGDGKLDYATLTQNNDGAVAILIQK